MKILISFCKKIALGSYRRIKNIPKLIFNKKYYYSDSYFPEKSYKSVFTVFFEQFWHTIRTSDINEFYFLFGFDGKNKDERREYIGYLNFLILRNRANNYSLPINHLILLRDKFVFAQFVNSFSGLSPENIFIIDKSVVWELKSGLSYSLDKLQTTQGDFFCKKINGECGDSVFPLSCSNGDLYINNQLSTIDELKSKLSGSMFVLQKKITQHVSINAIYSKAINTIRLTTIMNKDTLAPEFLSATLRLGTNGNFVDNWAVGGLIVNINSNGILDKYGFFKPGYGTKTDKHPDSKIKFEGYVIPNFSSIIEKAIKLHTYFYGIYSIGWDIAILEDGSPTFIEGNDNWEITLPQATIGGFNKIFRQYL